MAEWVAREISEAFPWDEAPRYLIRGRYSIYSDFVKPCLTAMRIRDKPTAPQSTGQNVYAEWLIGSISHEYVDHCIIVNVNHLHRLLRSYSNYYNELRTHE